VDEFLSKLKVTPLFGAAITDEDAAPIAVSEGRDLDLGSHWIGPFQMARDRIRTEKGSEANVHRLGGRAVGSEHDYLLSRPEALDEISYRLHASVTQRRGFALVQFVEQIAFSTKERCRRDPC
jgi:hypothetical protein